MLIELNETNFQSEVLDSSIPVLVDFWAERCAPCVQLVPVMEQLAQEVGDKAKICKMDAVANIKISSSYGVRSVPNLLFFKNGEVKDQVIGSGITKEQVKAKLEALV
jgi:thioredoxin 1